MQDKTIELVERDRNKEKEKKNDRRTNKEEKAKEAEESPQTPAKGKSSFRSLLVRVHLPV